MNSYATTTTKELTGELYTLPLAVRTITLPKVYFLIAKSLFVESLQTLIKKKII